MFQADMSICMAGMATPPPPIADADFLPHITFLHPGAAEKLKTC